MGLIVKAYRNQSIAMTIAHKIGIYQWGKKKMTINELIYDDNSFLIKMRMENRFDENDYGMIKKTIEKCIDNWKEQKTVPIKDFLAIIDFLDQTAGESLFMDKETNERVLDAHMEIYELLQELHYIQ